MEYLLPILIFLGLGLVSGILLAIASKAFAVESDPKIDEISNTLPSANCGACGYAGCADYADAIVTKGEKTNLCKPGGAKTSEKISEIMGVDATAFVPETAFVHCNGNCENTKREFGFAGVSSCAAAKRYYGGAQSCKFGCIGLGDCINVCEKNAISISDGIAVIDKSLCHACRKCIKICPNNLISLIPITKHYSVKCLSQDNGKQTKAVCKKGCIGCKICERKCMSSAIKIENFHAVIDYSKCIGCGQCFEVCPTGAIFCCEKQKAV